MDTRISVNTRSTWHQRSPDSPESASVRERMRAIGAAEYQRTAGRRKIVVTASRGDVEVEHVVRSNEHCASCSCSV